MMVLKKWDHYLSVFRSLSPHNLSPWEALLSEGCLRVWDCCVESGQGSIYFRSQASALQGPLINAHLSPSSWSLSRSDLMRSLIGLFVWSWASLTFFLLVSVCVLWCIRVVYLFIWSMHLLESVRWFDGLRPGGVSWGHPCAYEHVSMCARRHTSVLLAAAQYSLHTVTLWGVFINIPISAMPDCSICRNKLGIVFDIRLKTLWQEEAHKYEFICTADLVNEPSQGHYFSVCYLNGFAQHRHLEYRFHILGDLAPQKRPVGSWRFFPKW